METVEDVDNAMTWAMDHAAYEEKGSAQYGKNLKAGVAHLVPAWKDQLPNASRASLSWERMEGELEREPLCLGLTGILIERLGKRNHHYGWASLSQARDLLREQDVEHLRGEDVLVGGTEGARRVSLHFGVLARGETTKRGASQGVAVWDPLVAEFYRLRSEEVGPGGKIFNINMDRYRKEMHEELVAMGLADLGSLHLFRHSGAMYFKH
jgi:hypothetical protein